MSKKTEKKQPVMTPRKTAVTPAEKKAQMFRVGFVLIILVAMLTAPAFINWLSNRGIPTPDGFNWLPQTGLTYLASEEMEVVLTDNSGEGIFVYVGTPLCPACQQFEPTLIATLEYLDLGLRYFQFHQAFELNEELTQQIIYEIDDLARPRGWEGGVPVVMLFVNGTVVEVLEGIHSQEEIIEFFERHGGLTYE